MQKLNCSQVLSLLSFFIEKKLSKQIMQSVEYHLNICTECRKKYLNLQTIYKNCSDFNDEILSEYSEPLINFDKNSATDKNYKNFLDNLSAYIDNELDNNENLKIKKTAIANPDARKELENMLNFRQLLNAAFDKTKNNMKTDYSELTIQKLYNQITEKTINEYNPFLIIISGTLCTILLIILCVFVLH